jgi:hypothetical protein
VPKYAGAKKTFTTLDQLLEPDADVFMMDGQSLKLEVDDIYFITGSLDEVT